MSEEMVESAKVVMADTFRFYLRAHGYHWNVEGSDFLEYHQLFEKINWKEKSKLADERKEEDLNEDEKVLWKRQKEADVEEFMKEPQS